MKNFLIKGTNLIIREVSFKESLERITGELKYNSVFLVDPNRNRYKCSNDDSFPITNDVWSRIESKVSTAENLEYYLIYVGKKICTIDQIYSNSDAKVLLAITSSILSSPEIYKRSRGIGYIEVAENIVYSLRDKDIISKFRKLSINEFVFFIDSTIFQPKFSITQEIIEERGVIEFGKKFNYSIYNLLKDLANSGDCDIYVDYSNYSRVSEKKMNSSNVEDWRLVSGILGNKERGNLSIIYSGNSKKCWNVVKDCEISNRYLILRAGEKSRKVISYLKNYSGVIENSIGDVYTIDLYKLPILEKRDISRAKSINYHTLINLEYKIKVSKIMKSYLEYLDNSLIPTKSNNSKDEKIIETPENSFTKISAFTISLSIKNNKKIGESFYNFSNGVSDNTIVSKILKTYFNPKSSIREQHEFWKSKEVELSNRQRDYRFITILTKSITNIFMNSNSIFKDPNDSNISLSIRMYDYILEVYDN